MLAEPVNVISHLGGAAVFSALGWFLVRRGRGDWRRVFSLSVFVFCSVFLLAASGVYHLLEIGGTPRLVFRRLDHAGIYLLIAGTFTPIHVILFSGPLRWAVLLFVWIAATTGIALQSVFLEQMPNWLSIIFYLALGWTGLIAAWTLWRRNGWPFIAPLVFGGVAYSLGAGCLGLAALIDRPSVAPGVIGGHEIFHLFVLAGIGFHWKFIASFAAERSTRLPAEGEDDQWAPLDASVGRPGADRHFARD